jgi:catechol 2,3-dioxygenase-like lactoylglutathione lyase family enzyme
VSPPRRAALDHVVIAVSDWERSNAFYRDVLGAEPIDGAVEHLAALGIEVELGPFERHGARGPGLSVYFRDPDGSLLELISNA